MAKYGETSPSLIGCSCVIKSTHGSYQNSSSGVVVDETKTLLKIRVEGESYNWKFSKKDMLRTGGEMNDIAYYKLELNE
jgi:RNase P/RNase MRP subunit p29